MGKKKDEILQMSNIDAIEEKALQNEDVSEYFETPNVVEPVAVAGLAWPENKHSGLAKAELPQENIKTTVLPILPITEVARSYKQYKKHHNEILTSFCKSTGLPTEGTVTEMKDVLKKFGW